MRGTAWSRWSWLEEVVIPAVSAAMYAAWLTPLLRLLLGSALVYPRHLLYPWWGIVGVLLAGAWLSRLLGNRTGGRWLLAGIGALVVIGSVTAPPGTPAAAWRALAALVDFSRGMPAGLIVLLATVGLWFGGARARWTQHKQLMRGFVVGILALALLSLISPGVVTGEDLVTFLLAGLLALALLSVASHLAYQVARGLPRPPLSRYWLIALGLAMLAILATGWALSLFLAPQAMASLLGRLKPLLAFVGQVIAYVGMAIVWLLYTVYQFIAHLFQTEAPTPLPQESELPPSYTEQFPELKIEPGQLPSLPEGVGLTLLIIALVTVVAIAVIMAWRRRARPRYASAAAEEREFVWSKDLFLERWRGLFDGLRPRRHQELFDEALNLASARHRIRQAYRLLLLNARERGWARRRGQTVSAYGQRLAQAAPEAQMPVATLSAAYLQARYGDAEPPEALAEEARQASQAAVEAFTQPRRVGQR